MRTLLLIISLFSFLPSQAQKGKAFPELTGESLTGKSITLPSDTKGKKTLLAMAYSQKAEDLLDSWYQPIYDKFIAKLGMFDKGYDVNLYFVPMYIGLKQAAYESSLKELKASSRKDLFPHILFYKGKLEPYDKELKMTDKSQAYLFILDEKGNILYSTSGKYSENKMYEIEEVLN